MRIDDLDEITAAARQGDCVLYITHHIDPPRLNAPSVQLDLFPQYGIIAHDDAKDSFFLGLNRHFVEMKRNG